MDLDLKQAIRDFMVDDRTLDDAVRNNARIELRSIVGDHIYDGRKKQNAGPHAITLAGLGGQTNNQLAGPAGIMTPVIDITTWSKDGDAREAIRSRLDIALRDLLHQFRGNLNSEIAVQICNLEGEPFDRPISPIDASDGWTHRRSYSFMFAYVRTVPATAQAAVI